MYKMFHWCTKTRLLLCMVVITLFWICLITYNRMYDKAVIPNRIAKKTKHQLALRANDARHNRTAREENSNSTLSSNKVTLRHQPRDAEQEHTWATINEVPNVFVTHANCNALFHNSTFEQRRISKFMNETRSSKPTWPINCETFRKERQYMMSATSQEEGDFPIAFTIKMYRHPEMAERLLRAIYRPHNVYCIHVDGKAEARVYDMMRSVADCFPNVMMSQRVNVSWGTMSVVDAELMCMQTLWKYEWEYLINLTGEEFPLKTNGKIVRMLKTFNGTNAVRSSIKWADPKRWGDLKKRPPPHNITLTKGSLFVAATRGFVDFVLHNPIAHDFQKWVAGTKIPDETFFSSLNYNPHLGVPGSYKWLVEEGAHFSDLVRYKLWLSRKIPKDPAYRCFGSGAHSLCIFGVKDLPSLMNKPEMFVNKFHADYQPLAYDCMEELHYNRTREEILAES